MGAQSVWVGIERGVRPAALHFGKGVNNPVPISLVNIMKNILSVLVALILLGSNVAHANPANCDDDMTEDQRTQRDICSSHVGCWLVFKVYDSCAGAKNFLSRLKPRGNALSDDDVADALETSSGAPRSTARQCIVDRNMGKCKALLGIGPDPDMEEVQKKADALAEHLSSMLADSKSEQSWLASLTPGSSSITA